MAKEAKEASISLEAAMAVSTAALAVFSAANIACLAAAISFSIISICCIVLSIYFLITEYTIFMYFLPESTALLFFPVYPPPTNLHLFSWSVCNFLNHKQY